jgi:hypothetical protein
MIITLSLPLPCACLLDAPVTQGSYVYCGALATNGIATPDEGDAWVLLPVCPQHIRERVMTEDEITKPTCRLTKHT